MGLQVPLRELGVLSLRIPTGFHQAHPIIAGRRWKRSLPDQSISAVTCTLEDAGVLG